MVKLAISSGDKCHKCGITGIGNTQLPAVVFQFLTGMPRICDCCFFEMLTGEKVEWEPEFRKHLSYG